MLKRVSGYIIPLNSTLPMALKAASHREDPAYESFHNLFELLWPASELGFAPLRPVGAGSPVHPASPALSKWENAGDFEVGMRLTQPCLPHYGRIVPCDFSSKVSECSVIVSSSPGPESDGQEGKVGEVRIC